jgi:hypothetical protein
MWIQFAHMQTNLDKFLTYFQEYFSVFQEKSSANFRFFKIWVCRILSWYIIYNSKFCVLTSKAFWKTNLTEFKNVTPKFGVLNRNYEFSYRNFGFSFRNFEFSYRTFGFLTETSGFWTETSCFWKPEFRVFKSKLFVLQTIFFLPFETSCVDSWIFCDRNFGISNPY